MLFLPTGCIRPIGGGSDEQCSAQQATFPVGGSALLCYYAIPRQLPYCKNIDELYLSEFRVACEVLICRPKKYRTSFCSLTLDNIGLFCGGDWDLVIQLLESILCVTALERLIARSLSEVSCCTPTLENVLLHTCSRECLVASPKGEWEGEPDEVPVRSS